MAMMDRAAVSVGLIAALVLTGCDKVPGTPKNKAATALKSMAFDPSAAKIAFVTETPHAVCGTVNGKNRMGAYVGAAPFIYDKATGATRVYGGQPDSYEIRRLDDTKSDDPEWQKLYSEIDAKCQFPNEWDMNCKTALPADGEGHICKIWRSDGNGPTKIMAELRPDPF